MDPERWTVDELAADTGLTVRTVRFYAAQGFLPPPERSGRVAHYDRRHRRRLELVRTLQEHGYTLAAVGRVLDRIPDDADAAEYAVQAAVLAPWLPDSSQVLDRAGLERAAGRALSEAEIGVLIDVRAVETVEGGYRAHGAALRPSADLLALPVPDELLRRSAELIDEHATAVADGLSELFAEAIWAPYQRGELSHDDVVAILDRLRPLALQGLVGTFTRAADDAARRRLEP